MEAGNRREGAPKPHLIPFDDLSNRWEESPTMAHRRLTFDPQGKENTLSVGNKLPRANGGNIKDKISLWEGKEPPHPSGPSGSAGQRAGVNRTESPTNTKISDGQRDESCRRKVPKEKQALEKEGAAKPGSSRPRSPGETGKQKRGLLKTSESRADDGGRAAHEEEEHPEKENVEKIPDPKPPSPTATVSPGKRTSAQTSQGKRAVFTLFKKLEAMGEKKTPPELGNYFSPPSKQVEVKNKEPQSDAVGWQEQENPYTEPGSPPINPLPKPRRTFQHPAAVHPKNQRQGRGQRRLPPLPSTSSRPASKPPLGVYGAPRGDGVRDRINR